MVLTTYTQGPSWASVAGLMPHLSTHDSKLLMATIVDELGWDTCRDLLPGMPSSAATLSAARWLDTNKQISNTPSQCSNWNGLSPDDFAQMARLHILEHGLKPGVDPVMHTQWKSKKLASHAVDAHKNHRRILMESVKTPSINLSSNPWLVAALNLFYLSLDPTSQKIWDMKWLGYSQTTIALDLGISSSAVSQRVAKWPSLLAEWVKLQLTLSGVM